MRLVFIVLVLSFCISQLMIVYLPADGSRPCLSAMPIPFHPVLHGFEGSAWARSLGVPLSDLRLYCGLINGLGGRVAKRSPKFYT